MRRITFLFFCPLFGGFVVMHLNTLREDLKLLFGLVYFLGPFRAFVFFRMVRLIRTTALVCRDFPRP